MPKSQFVDYKAIKTVLTMEQILEVALMSETNEILERIPEVNDSVGSIARHLKREADTKSQPVPIPPVTFRI